MRLMTAAATDIAAGRHISGRTTCVLLRWVRNLTGEAGVTALLEAAGESRSVAELEDHESWSSYQQAIALLEAAVSVTGRPDAARRIGEEMLEQHRDTPMVDLLRSLGSPQALVESIAASGAKFSTILVLAPRRVSPGYAVVAGQTVAGIPRHRLLCDFTIGTLSVVPAVFGMDPAVVTETECQARGAAQCVYHMAWDPASAAEAEHDPVRRVRYLEAQLADARRRLAAVQATSAHALAGTDLDAALAAVVRGAAGSVGAHALVLAATLPGSRRRIVHAAGCTDAEATRLADADAPVEDERFRNQLSAPIRSAEQHYGALTAYYPAHLSYLPQEYELLRTHAQHAAAALDTAAALNESRRQARTARALLQLADALSRVASRDDVAQRLVDAVPQLVDCDSASVLLWDEAAQRLTLRASVGLVSPFDAMLRSEGIQPSDTPALRRLMTDPAPLFISRDDPDPYLAELMAGAGLDSAAAVAITEHGRFHGVITADVRDGARRLIGDPDVVERLRGLASHGANALESAALLEELQQRALHDPLTGQPNRSLLFDRLQHALASRRPGSVALMFIDLDRFKDVNDAFGHLVGDRILVDVADRLATTVRAEDTVARLGGDEFAVLLDAVSGEEEASTCAQRVIDALRPALRVEEREFAISASIGVCLAVPGVADPLDLLRAADAAMYRAKARGGGTFVLTAAAVPAEPALP